MSIPSLSHHGGKLCLLVVLLCLVAPHALFGQDPLDGPCGTNPKGKPRRIKGGEAFPPLPLPVTPLRRTERKRNPSAPTLVGKVKWGEAHTFTNDQGKELTYEDWNYDPSDIKRLLDLARHQLELRYKSQAIDLESFSFNPDEVPILWITGVGRPEFSSEIRAKLSVYLEEGGTLWADACRGSASFCEGFRKEAALILPNHILRPLGPDHPVFSCAIDLKGKASYSKGTTDRPRSAPYLEGVNIGCRTAVFLCPYALSCAWDSGHVTEGCAQMLEDSALALGMNMLVYTLAYRPLGKFLSRPHQAFAADPSEKGFVFAQARFKGEYDPDPGAFGNLLRHLSTRTSIEVALNHPFVFFSDENLSDYPFLYLTGHGPFALSQEEEKGLRAFLERGGFLLADACCADLAFDLSFRKAMARIFGNSALKEIPGDDPLFQAPEKINAVCYTPKVLVTWPGMEKPLLEGISREGAWCVVYSRFDLGCGWEGEPHPYRMGVENRDALRIAENVILYAMTH